MLSGLSDNDLDVSSVSLDAALGALVRRLEQALGYGAVDDASIAYERYSECYLGVLAGTVAARDLTAAGQQLGDVLGRLVDRSDVRGEIDDAAADYVQDLVSACAQLDVPSLEDISSIASATTLLAVLYGADQLGSNQLNNMVAGTSSLWSRDPLGHQDDEPNTDFEEDAMPDDVDTSSSAADEEIVWQEFAVGDDGQIVERTHHDDSPAPPPTNGDASRSTADDRHRRRDGARREGNRQRRPDRSTGSHPVELIEAATQSYLAGLAAAGITIDRIPDAGGHTAGSFVDLERQNNDVTASYLRTAWGVGNVSDLYGSYARLLASIAQLVEHHLDQVRQFDQISTFHRPDPRDRIRSAERLYERFLASTRDAWSHVDPAGLAIDELAAMNRAAAQTATVHEAVTGRRHRAGEP